MAAAEIAWRCQDCPWTSASPNLDGPIMHENVTGHQTEAAPIAIRAWGKALGKGWGWVR